jgi:two-component system, chemotaxis family, chemotaxis protein CheY
MIAINNAQPIPTPRVLIVDDSRAMRGILRRMLSGLGFMVAEASNGREAFDRLLAGEAADLVLVDWNMPELNGYDFIVAVRSDPMFNRLRLMMVTTETEMPQVTRALAAGADEYVMKPFTPDVISGKLALLGLVPVTP